MFRSIAERATHEESCPQRAQFETKWTQSQAVYHKHKGNLKSGQKQRKNQMSELFGHDNGPMASEMPTLHYKYRMNEPFINGEAG